ncbi:MAG: hypothetical protein L3K18_09530 [Thermoplasmata archaeon]|nr:hypothetical protein [Thermoplasmata archaeon]
MQLAQYTQFTVLSGGLEINLGNARGWLSVVVDTVAGQGSGTGITVLISGFKVRQTFQVNYGAPALTIPFSANRIKVTGTGAVIELLIDTDHVVVAPVVLTPGTVLVGGTVNTDFGQSSAPASLVASADTSASIVQSISGVPMAAVSAQDPPQLPVTGGKAIPVKTVT